MKKREEVINHVKDFFKEKAFLYKLENVFLYGSWARGFPRDDSDIDIAVIFSEKPLSLDETFKLITDISLSLSEGIGMEVNVIPIQHDFNRPMLYYNAIVLGEPVFVKDYNKYVTLKNEAIYQMEDFNIFGTGWWFRIARNNLEALRNG